MEQPTIVGSENGVTMTYHGGAHYLSFPKEWDVYFGAIFSSFIPTHKTQFGYLITNETYAMVHPLIKSLTKSSPNPKYEHRHAMKGDATHAAMHVLNTIDETIIAFFHKLSLKVMCDGLKDNNRERLNLKMDLIFQYAITRFSPKRGDLIGFECAGYRNTELYIFDGKSIIDLEDDDHLDEYGYIPKQFKVITEFPITYWTDRIGHNNYVWIPDTLKLGTPVLGENPPGYGDVELHIVDNSDSDHFGYVPCEYNGVTYYLILGSESSPIEVADFEIERLSSYPGNALNNRVIEFNTDFYITSD